MFPFGHVGLTAGVIAALLILVKRQDILFQVDFRLVVVIAMFPDMIDKVLGHFILQDSLNNGRIYFHTLAFYLLFSVVCFIIFKKKFWIYASPFLMHQIFDHMWEAPKTWFWPIHGWKFTSFDYNVWNHWFQELFNEPYILITELAGLCVILAFFFAFRLYKKDAFLYGLKKGRLLDRDEKF
jgi:inner membrane protein